VQKTLVRLVRPGSVFFDIGANIGFFTLLGARLVGPSGIVVAFEPHPENSERLRRNIELNLFSNVVVVQQAVSDTSGDRLLDSRHAATASIVSSDDARRVEGLLRVEATSVDDYVDGRPDLTPDVVKIDAEGHEIEIVRGMQTTLERSGPVLICEMHRRIREFTDAVERAGYRTAALQGVGAAESLPPLGHVLAAPTGHRALAGQ
jgi:FkbM family methyltransferase